MFSYLFSESSRHLVGNVLGSKILGSLASGVGAYIGSDLDRYILSGNQKTSSGRIDSFAVQQTIAYGVDIPIIFGRGSICGNIIWVGAIEEDITSYKIKYGSIFKRKIIHEEYCYLADFAVAVCQGEARICQIFADDQLLDINDKNIKIYPGSRTQQPDPTITTSEGQEDTPAFRDLCYVVFKNFPLNDFGHFPRFLFTVEKEMENIKNAKCAKFKFRKGDFSLDTTSIYKFYFIQKNGFKLITSDNLPLNHNSSDKKTDIILELENIKTQFPELEWIEIELFWYLEKNEDQIKLVPAVEHKEINSQTIPYEWQVAIYTRANARLAGSDEACTPNDKSLQNFYQASKEIGLKVSLKLSFIAPKNLSLGHLNSQAKDLLTNSYQNMLSHYQQLKCADAYNVDQDYIKQQISEPPKEKFIEMELLAKNNRGFFVDKMLKTLLTNNVQADHPDYYDIDAGKLAFHGLVIKNLSYKDLLTSISLLKKLEFFTDNGKISIKQAVPLSKISLEAQWCLSPKSEFNSYNRENYMIIYPDGTGNINKYFIKNDPISEFTPIEINFTINCPEEDFAIMKNKLCPNKKIICYAAMYNPSAPIYGSPLSIEFNKDFMLKVNYNL